MEREDGSCVTCFKVLLEQKGKLDESDIKTLGKGISHCNHCLKDLQHKYKHIVDNKIKLQQ